MSSSTSRSVQGLGVVFRSVLAEVRRSVSLGWGLVTFVSLPVCSWATEPDVVPGNGLICFAGNFAILCTGDIPGEEHVSGRVTALLRGGVSRGTLFPGVCLVWTVVFLGGNLPFVPVLQSWSAVGWGPPR